MPSSSAWLAGATPPGCATSIPGRSSMPWAPSAPTSRGTRISPPRDTSATPPSCSVRCRIFLAPSRRSRPGLRYLVQAHHALLEVARAEDRTRVGTDPEAGDPIDPFVRLVVEGRKEHRWPIGLPVAQRARGQVARSAEGSAHPQPAGAVVDVPEDEAVVGSRRRRCLEPPPAPGRGVELVGGRRDVRGDAHVPVAGQIEPPRRRTVEGPGPRWLTIGRQLVPPAPGR